MDKNRALIVDDEPDIRELIELTLERMHIETESVADVRSAEERLKHRTFHLCLTDMRLPDGSGLDLVGHIQRHHPNLPVAVITAYGNVESAVQALKLGAFDFVSKPVDINVLRNLVSTALKTSRQYPDTDRRSRRTLLGDSSAMQHIRATILKLARSQAPVYISGESGTGKELVARLIHEKGPRTEKPFVPVNCGAIPSELMESEFFGHKKGSFTGANTDKEGLFQAANGGTLFLDEVAELPLHMQVKLLRVIQEKALRPVGTQHEIPIDVRILSATHKNLADLVQQGQFRQDLFYRINVIELKVPPLRERRDDIAPLAEHILQQQGHTTLALSAEALAALQSYRFPGNVRELENILERATTLCESNTLRAEDLQLRHESPHTQDTHAPEDEDDSDLSKDLEGYLGTVEKQRIVDALQQTRYNKTAAAKLLGISFRALRYRLKKLGLD
jgi:two-component system, NtrC family, response regulator PilR